MLPEECRSEVVARLAGDILGPMEVDEALPDLPTDVYMTGILWPYGDRMGAEDDDGGPADETGDEPAGTAIVGQQRPCAMGVSFATRSQGPRHKVAAVLTCAIYEPAEAPAAGPEDAEGGRAKSTWRRRPLRAEVDIDSLAPGARYLELPVEGLRLQLVPRCEAAGDTLLWTVTVFNRSDVADADRITRGQRTVFQAELQLSAGEGTLFTPRPHQESPNDPDEASGRLLYRDHRDYAAGHQCSATWQESADGTVTIRSTWLPQAVVPAFKASGDLVFDPLLRSGRLSASWLAEAATPELADALGELAEAYGNWIAARRGELPALPEDLRATGQHHLDQCEVVRDRIRAGAAAIAADPELREAFRLANRAMALQHAWKGIGAAGHGDLVWRPFQLAFVLLSLQSTTDPAHDDRGILDLLWFPTGGGKTEAYLALTATAAWHRRLSAQPGNPQGAGNVAIMRYTLRLLTAQQFQRAAALILACEALRQQQHPAVAPFSIGLWVGGDATPNNYAAAKDGRGNPEKASAEQMERCPACGARLQWHYSDAAESVRPACAGADCPLGIGAFGRWPVFTVDSDIYRERPTLLIGTVDKFAQLPFKAEIGHMLGFGTPAATDLVIQDELHLISGPLGTLTGLYETAYDWLLRKGDARPKVIGSTATIRRAAEQIRHLFDRGVCQFPPPGLSHANSGFAVIDEDHPGRLYVGVTTAGRSGKFALQGVAASLLQSGRGATAAAPAERDGYFTLLAYYNALRELGAAIVAMLDDVPDSMELYASRRGEAYAGLAPPLELTSRVSQKEIVDILQRLERRLPEPDVVDVVLATNMVSVGVDVARLALMLVNGQPKTRSEYIQSTSRVGRAASPGLVVTVLNAAKARDRSHFETFPSWHHTIYRDVEATSVTPFASRARDRAMRTILVSMIRHADPAMATQADLASAADATLRDVVEEIERRIGSIDPGELSAATAELDDAMQEWDARHPSVYLNRYKTKESLLMYAEDAAVRRAAGRRPLPCWPTMTSMRSVEASTPFRMAESLADGRARPAAGTARWRRNTDGQ